MFFLPYHYTKSTTIDDAIDEVKTFHNHPLTDDKY